MRFYESDWHIHSECSYDSELKIADILKNTAEMGITEFGITDHVNYPWMIVYLKKAAELHEKYRSDHFHLGVELSPDRKSKYDYCRSHPIENPKSIYKAATSVEGYDVPLTDEYTPLDLPLTEEEIRDIGVEYVIGAPHFPMISSPDRKKMIDDYHRQHMFLANDSRVDIIGHPWWIYDPRMMDDRKRYTGGPWFDDFGHIPEEYHQEFAEAVIQNGKCVELNGSFYLSSQYTEKFKQQYAAYICKLHDMGVPITMGTDAHNIYRDLNEEFLKYFEPLGFHASSFSKPKLHNHKK